jgi:hypothetical protein
VLCLTESIVAKIKYIFLGLHYSTIMATYLEKVSPEDKARIKKTSTQRLFKWVVDIGISEDEAEKLTRDQLVEAYAEAIVTGTAEKKSVKSVEGAAAKSGSVHESEVERDRLEWEKVKWVQEIEERRLDRELEDKELKLKEKEMEQSESMNNARREEIERNKNKERSAVYQAKLFGDALRGTLPKMPTDSVELVSYFRGVEQLFSDFKVEPELRVHLLKPHLTEMARTLITRMDSVKACKYEEVKNMLLHEFKMSPSALLDKFNNIMRGSDETYTLYANRLKSVLMYYTEARKAVNYDVLIDLLVRDRVKSCLSQAALRQE